MLLHIPDVKECLTRPDNAPEKWELEEHTKVKHQILEKYIRSWISILSSRNEKMGYFDCFAGRGVYNNGEPGSPIIVMNAAQEQIDRLSNLKKFNCAFIENNKGNFVSLEEEVTKYKLNCNDIECSALHGDFDKVITDFLDQYEGKFMIPVLYFIDPFGWKGISFDDIKRILSHRFSEVLFVLMTYEMARWCESPYHAESLTELFGGDEWKEATKYKEERRHQALVQIYEDKLQNDTDAKFVWSFGVNDSDMEKRTKYYIVHATHHIKGLRVMKNIMRKEGSGIFRYLGPEDDILKRQQRFDFFDFERYLLDYFQGRVVTFDDICDELYPVSRHQISKYIDTDYRKALKILRKDGKIRVDSVTSKTPRGLQGKDLVYFP